MTRAMLRSDAEAHQTMLREAVSCVKYMQNKLSTKEGVQKVCPLIVHDQFLIILSFTCLCLFYSQSQSLKEERVCWGTTRQKQASKGS